MCINWSEQFLIINHSDDDDTTIFVHICNSGHIPMMCQLYIANSNLKSTLSDKHGQQLHKLDMAQCGLVLQTWRDMVDWQFCLVGFLPGWVSSQFLSDLAPSNWDSEHNIENIGFSQFLLTHCICSFSRKDGSLGGWPGRYVMTFSTQS